MKKHRLLYFPIAILFLLSFVDCAKKGSPSGGPKDSIPPIIVKSVPENYSINFDQKEIRIYFNEYIKLKDVNKELIISPPLKYTPTITPLTSGKFIKLKILDTLEPNTTYSFSFGKSIVDNNEENPFDFFKYVLSTGDYIDSLKLNGKVKDAQLFNPEIPSTVMLYEIDEHFNDSVIFSEKPNYITVTKDSASTFEFTNIKEGNYLLIALKEKNNDYTFQPELDKIGFFNEIITIPTDENYELTLFKEIPDYEIDRPRHVSKNHILFGFKGEIDSLNIEELSAMPDGFEKRTFLDLKTDTIHYWFKPSIELDSLQFRVTNKKEIDTLLLRVKDQYKDSLQLSALNSGNILVVDTLKVHANIPIVSIDPEKIKVIDRDSVNVPVSINLDPKFNVSNIVFEKDENQIYLIELLPGALLDFFEKPNDSTFYRVTTKANSDYGTLNVTLENAPDIPIIVQLVNSRFKLISEELIDPNNEVFFNYIPPANYYIRLIYDENGNGKWDTGNYLKRVQPEKIIYYPSLLDIRANWSLNETFTLD